MVCAQVEHFYEYRAIVKEKIERQLKELPVETQRQLTSIAQ